MEDYISINKDLWNTRTEIHFDSEFYDNKSFIEKPQSLNSIELELLGDISGKKILHLQCHFGQDSISLAKMGAQVTGIDFSEKAIERAKELNKEVGTDVRFLLSDVYNAREVCQEDFDIVFTSYGVIGWLPDMSRWAKTVQQFLKPGGILILAEFHPFVWMWSDDFSKIQYPYSSSEAFIETEEGTYTNPDADVNKKAIFWNHGLSDVINPLLKQDLKLKSFKEYDYSPYNCFQNTIEISPKRFQIKGFEGKMPMVYAFRAVKK